MDISIECKGVLESQIASKDARNVTKVAKVDSVEEHPQIAEEGTLLMLAPILENVPHLHATEEACPSAERVLGSV